MPYSLPELDYDYSALEPYYSAQMLELHHSKHHAAYVSGLNAVLEQLDSARDSNDFEAIAGLEKKLAFNLSGHVLHTLFWKNLSPSGGDKPTGQLAAGIDEFFGSFDRFMRQLSEATVTVQGSGWGALAWEPLGQRLYVAQIYDHQDNIGQSSGPLLVLDAWEHAYYLQYQNRRADYVDAMWNVVGAANSAQFWSMSAPMARWTSFAPRVVRSITRSRRTRCTSGATPPTRW